MKENIKIYTLSSLLFIYILNLSSMMSGIASSALYIGAFLIPSMFCLYFCKHEKSVSYLGIKPRIAIELTPLMAPSLFLIFILSFISFVLINSLTGKTSALPITGSFIYDLYSLALLPATLEELLFRYIPLKILAPYSKKSTIIISSLLFALVHTSFFSIPYAFVAGIIFMVFDMMTESIYPSVMLHLINNIISVIWLYISASESYAWQFVISFAAIASLSLIFVFVKRKRYIYLLGECFNEDDKTVFHPIVLALAVPTIFVAVTDLL